MSSSKLIGRAARYQAELLSSDLWPGKEGWPIAKPVLRPVPSENSGWVVRVSRDLCTKRSAGKLKVQEEGHCRLCRRASTEEYDPQGRPDAVRLMTRHHLVPRSYWRKHPKLAALYRDVDANIVGLCTSCHELVETEVESRRMLRHALTQAEIAFIIQVRGVDWLEHRYPLRA